MRANPIYIVLSVLLLAHTVSCQRECKTTDDYDLEVPFVRFFDTCYLDTSEVNAFGSIAAQFHTWFSIELYPVYVVVAIFTITMVSFSENAGSDDVAMGNAKRLHAYVVIMRLGLVISMIPWLWAALTQERPCVCRYSPVGEYLPFIPIWGMPSDTAFAGTVVGFHIMQSFNIPLGIIFTLLSCAATVVAGQFSIGQVIVGLLFGVAIHFYSTRTPIFARLFDFVATLIGGLVCLFVQKSHYPAQDFSFSVFFFIGIAWQLYGFALVLLTYEWEFVKVVIRRSTSNLHHVDFMYYKPLNSNPSDSSSSEFKYPHDTLWITIATVVLFLVLCGLKVATQYMNDVFLLP